VIGSKLECERLLLLLLLAAAKRRAAHALLRSFQPSCV
jgi:hypothetical protein